MKQKLHYLILPTLVILLNACSKKDKTLTAQTAASTVAKIAVEKIAIHTESFSERILQLQQDSVQNGYQHRDSILDFYTIRNNKPAWTLPENRKQLFEAIQKSYQEGLLPEDYQLKALEKTQRNPFSKANDNIAIDLLYTDIYLSYAYHLANGKIDYKTLHDDWNLPQNNFQFNSILNQAIHDHNIFASLERFKPTQPTYLQLKNILATHKNLIHKDSARTIIAQGNKIRPNKSDKRIVNIRKRLSELGFHKDSLHSKSIILDSVLQIDIKKFQKTKNLATDAIIGKGTITELNKSNQDRYNSILANLERWRWFPRYFGDDFIVVNIPEYKLQYFTKKDTTQYNVVVGKTKRKTPVFNADIKYLVFNPKWHIPPTIKNEDIIPAALKNPSSITRKRITIYNREGKVMHPDSVKWDSPTPANYRYVQSAGRNNALGLVKIIFPNPYAVFLHDTNHRNLFVKNYRARSSGCVRVEKPFKLASEILQWKTEKVDSIIAKRNTKRVYTKHKTTVYMLYWSIVFNHSNQPLFIHDTYDFDNTLSQKLLK